MDSVAPASLSDGASPTSPLHDTGEETEAVWDLFQLNEMNNDLTGDSSSFQLQDGANMSPVSCRNIPNAGSLILQVMLV